MQSSPDICYIFSKWILCAPNDRNLCDPRILYTVSLRRWLVVRGKSRSDARDANILPLPLVVMTFVALNLVRPNNSSSGEYSNCCNYYYCCLPLLPQ